MVLAIAEFYHWWGGTGLPLPLIMAAGVVLAIASNRGRLVKFPWRSPHAPPLKSSKPASVTNVTPKPPSPTIEVLETTPIQPPRRGPELPQFNLPASPKKPISFSIRKPD